MRFVTGLAAWALLMPAALAAPDSQTPTLDIQLFHPAPGGNNFINTESGDVNSSFGLSVGVNFDYARNPLAIKVIKPDGSQEDVGLVVKNRLDANLFLALGLFDFADVGVVMPFIFQGGFDGDAFNAAGVQLGSDEPKSLTQGDLRVVPKVRFLNLNEGLLSAALVGTVIIPSAQGTPYAGENNIAYAPSIALSTRTDLVRAGVQLGYVLRDRTKVQTLIIDDEVTASAALALNLNIGKELPFEVIGEVFGRTPSQNAFALRSKGTQKDFQKARTTLEGDVGIRYEMVPNYFLMLGGGGGLLPGYGAPAPRAYLSLMFYSGEKGFADQDQDGVGDDSDKCPDKKEDKDNFEDGDGCPERDNDRDTVVDEDDQCPNEPEDKDGYRDEDGCPEPDNDNDGLLDAADKCPTEAEDKDGFEDEDGCPDVDDDKDGVADAVDKCPREAEDKDQFQDSDGCPEPDNDGDGLNDLGDLCPNNPEDKDGVEDDDGCAEDNDKDGIEDAQDKCPNKAETYNGIEDEDGCPEVLKAKSLVEVKDDKIEIKDKIFFKTGSAAILPKSFGLLDQVVSVLKNYKTIAKLRVEGHTDNTGNRKANVKLSKDRAESVRKYLVDHGVEAARLESEGFGPDKPISSNKTAKGKEMNRRVEFMIVDKKPVGVDLTEAPPPPPAQTEPVIEMPGMDAPPPAGNEPKKDEGLFQMDVGSEGDKAGDTTKKKDKKKKDKKKKEDGGDVEFNF